MPAVDANLGAIRDAGARPYATVRKGFTAFANNDVIMAKITPCMENGKAALTRDLQNGIGFGSTEFHVLRSMGAVLPEYIYYFIRQESFRRAAENEMTGSVGQKRVPADFINNAEIPLPPFVEQERIVNLLNQLVIDTRSVRDRLGRLSSQLKHFRQAVLAAACSGKLTEEWRAQWNDSETGEQLVQQILKQRATTDRSESPLAMRQPDSEVPNSWYWTSLDTLVTDGPQNGLYKPSSEYGEGGSPIIRIEDFQNDSVRTRRELSKLRLSKQEADKYAVHPNDLVINRVNSPSHIGKCLLVPSDLCPAVFESNMMRITLSPEMSPVWVATYIRSDSGRARLTADAKWAVNQVSINQTDVVTTPVPVPSRREQDEIIRRVEALFKLADAIEKRVAAASARAEKLTQAILAKAFRGELVLTEAELARREGWEYEPASVLLERIKKEREKASANKERRKRTSIKA